MLLRKEQGGSTVAGFEWELDGDVVDVPDDLAMDLLAIKGGGYSVPEPAPVPVTDPPADPAADAKTKADARAKAKADADAAAKALADAEAAEKAAE